VFRRGRRTLVRLTMWCVLMETCNLMLAGRVVKFDGKKNPKSNLCELSCTGL
jgi:hypothetical protein